MSLLILFFLLILVWPIPIALATVFYIQKRRLQQTIDAIKQIINDTNEELQGDKTSKRQSSYLRKRKEEGTIEYQNL